MFFAIGLVKESYLFVKLTKQGCGKKKGKTIIFTTASAPKMPPRHLDDLCDLCRLNEANSNPQHSPDPGSGFVFHFSLSNCFTSIVPQSFIGVGVFLFQRAKKLPYVVQFRRKQPTLLILTLSLHF